VTTSYSIVDTAANIQAIVDGGDADGVLAGADAITADPDVALDLTLAQQVAFNVTTSYSIVDTAANIQAIVDGGDADGVLAGADAITADPDVALDLSIDEFNAFGILLTTPYIITDLSDTIVDDDTGLNAAITGSVNVKLTNNPTLAQLIAINDATDGDITLEDTGDALTGSAEDLTDAFAGTITTYTSNFTVNNVGSIEASLLSGLDEKTSGLLIAAGITELTGSATDVIDVTANLGTTGNKISLGSMAGIVTNAAVTLNGEATLANLLAIDQATSGVINATDVESLSGSVTQIQTIINNLGTGFNQFNVGNISVAVTDVDFTVSGTSLSATNLNAISDATTGTIDFSDDGITITGIAADIDKMIVDGGITLPEDFNVVMSVTGSTGAVLDTLSFNLVPNTTGSIQLVGSNTGNILNFSSISKGLTIDGDAGNDTITGTALNDVIIGGAGNDTITLGAGNDAVRFNSLTGSDTITDFSVADDSIQLARSVMTQLSGGASLTVAEFEVGTAATSAATRIVYNQSTGVLSYDANGSDAGGVTTLATFTGQPVLTVDDFSIV
jgi:Ca2+-binding RTX toxin-like protein